MGIAEKAGFSRYWGIVAIFPALNLIALWVFAFVEWPALATESKSYASDDLPAQ
jgi:hypothetical protein